MVEVASQCPATARLALCGPSDRRGYVDGAWWPPNNALGTSLADLVSVLGLSIGPVRRVLYDPSAWESAPSRIIRGTTVISVDPYTLVARDTVYLLGTHSRNCLLYVVPPTSADADVRQLLRAVSDAPDPMSVSTLRELVRRFPGVRGAR